MCRNSDIKVLITTGNTKFYSNGLDLEELSEIGTDPVRLMQFDKDIRSVNRRILAFPGVTIAAMNGERGREGREEGGR